MGVEIGIIHYCEGAGHAMRMLAIAEELEERGFSTKITGGGPGEKFVELNRGSNYSPAEIDIYELFNEKGVLWALAKLPSEFLDRLSDLRKWIRKEDPEVLLTDGPIGPIAAILERKKLYTLQHTDFHTPESLTDKLFTYVYTRFLSIPSSRIFYPAIWDEATPAWAEEVEPIAPKGEEMDLDFDILVVPTRITDETRTMVDSLEKDYRVKLVGSEDWEIQPSLQPFIEEADAVVCSGHTTIMEASVAGTPCVMVPHTSEQIGVAKRLDGYKGFKKFSGDINSDLKTLEKLEPRENGAKTVADILYRDLSEIK